MWSVGVAMPRAPRAHRVRWGAKFFLLMLVQLQELVMTGIGRINGTELAPVLIDEMEESKHLKDSDIILYTVALNYLCIFGLWPFSLHIWSSGYNKQRMLAVIAQGPFSV